jgi:hypothetical protein
MRGGEEIIPVTVPWDCMDLRASSKLSRSKDSEVDIASRESGGGKWKGMYPSGMGRMGIFNS